MKKRDKHKKKLKFILWGIVVILFLAFLVYFFWPVKDTIFSFTYGSTNEKVNGEVFFDDKYYGYTKDGSISVPYMEELPENITFKGTYEGMDFELIYEFPKDYWEYYECPFLVEISNTSNSISSNKKAELYFYDNKTLCHLNGNISLEDRLIGESKEGKFILSKTDYDSSLSSIIKIKGLTDSCFGEDENLPFVEYSAMFDLDYYFENNETKEFSMELNLRSPSSFEAAQGFIRPEETREYLDKYLDFENHSEEDLDEISKVTMRYKDDFSLFNKDDYWQTPKETLNRREGDCEDWAVSTLSMMREYNNSLECYDARWYSHISIICFLGNKIIFYDQGDSKFSAILNSDLTELERKAKIRGIRNNYLETYNYLLDDKMVFALFNEKNLIIFETEEGFVDWVVNR